MYSVLLPMCLIIFFFYTTYFIGPPRISLPMFVTLTIFAFLLPHLLHINSQIAIKAMMFYPCFSIFRLSLIFYFTVSWKDSINMDLAYAFLIPIASNIIYLRFFYKEECFFQKFITIVLTIVNAVFLVQCVLYGSRGPILCLILLVVFLWMIKNDNDTYSINYRKMYFSILIGFVMLISFIEILSFLEEFLASYNISVLAISKILNLSQSGDISNGRENIVNNTFSLILDRPFCGYGLDRFESVVVTSSYPHNFLLQILFDGGIALLLLFSPFVYYFKKTIKNVSKEVFILLVVLFFTSIPGALFSQDLWNISILWLFLGTLVSKDHMINENL